MGLFDSIASLFTTHDINRANLAAVDRTNAANAALWREQTAYNAPEAQMQRLQSAGLNPNLVYGQIAESRAATPPSMGVPHYERPITSFDEGIAQYSQVKNLQALNQRMVADAESAKADAIKRASDADYSVWENESLKKAGVLKSDPTLLKEFQRGTSVLGDYLSTVIKRINSVTDSWNKKQEGINRNILLKRMGDAEKAHDFGGDFEKY